jgi:hypothetical protein
MGRVRRRTFPRVTAQNILHLILQLELALLQSDFFYLLGFGEVMASGQVVNLFVEDVVLRGQLPVLVVDLHQLALQLFEVFRHFRLLEKRTFTRGGRSCPHGTTSVTCLQVTVRIEDGLLWRRAAGLPAGSESRDERMTAQPG